MQKESIDKGLISDQDYDDAIFKSQENFEKDISRLCDGDLYVIGRLWIQTLRKVLVGADLVLIPVVLAAQPTQETVPQKPPKMKYKDLPIYESPHYEYKDYLEDKKKCPKANVKILQTYLYPKVKSYRQSWVNSIRDFNKDAKELKNDGCKFVCKKKDELICYLRSPDNLMVRRAILATGMMTGFFVGRGAGLLRRLFGTTAGGLATGALVFPKETDEVFRDTSFKVGKFGINMFNNICGKKFALREKIPCRDDMPSPPPVRLQKNECELRKK